MLTDDQFGDQIRAQLRAEVAGVHPRSDLLGSLRRQARRARIRRLGVAAVPVAVASMVAAGVLAGGGTQVAPAGRGPATSAVSRATLRSVILTAFNGAAREILWDRQIRTVSGHTYASQFWYSPAQARPGQVEITRQVSLGAGGRPEGDTVSSFRVPRNGSGLVVSKVLDVVYATHTWSDRKYTYPYKPVVSDGAAIRRRIAAGQLSVAGTGIVDGQRVIKLTWHDGPGAWTDLWVDAHTYLPVKSVSVDTVGRPGHMEHGITTDRYIYLPPTAANLARLRVAIPSGFTRTAQPELPPSPGGGKG